MQSRIYIICSVLMLGIVIGGASVAAAERPHIVLMMADDQGWGETSYNGHPILKTPNLDAMAESGLRFDRFYASAPVCSPTRASVLTGRTNNRTGVESHGFALRLQEKTLPQALAKAGYRCGHFGKWHLNGLRGPGVPILKSDDHNPGEFGFHEWLSVTNFFDRDPILSRKGKFEEHRGDSSEIVVDEALKFIEAEAKQGKPTFTVIWFGTPHSPFRAAEEDMTEFSELDQQSKNHYGELVALDRSVGTLRAKLRELEIADNTLFWYCSDNGGLPKITPETVGGLRGFKGSLYEGGLRVPGIIEWPTRIKAGRITNYSAGVVDIFPTIVELLELGKSSMLFPQDGQSLVPLLHDELPASAVRNKPLVFNCFGETAIIHKNLKLLQLGRGKSAKKQRYEVYDLSRDGQETKNIYSRNESAVLRNMMLEFQKSLARSIAGQDYPEARVRKGEPMPRFWTDVEAYRVYFDDWRDRPEYASRLKDK